MTFQSLNSELSSNTRAEQTKSSKQIKDVWLDDSCNVDHYISFNIIRDKREWPSDQPTCNNEIL